MYVRCVIVFVESLIVIEVQNCYSKIEKKAISLSLLLVNYLLRVVKTLKRGGLDLLLFLKNLLKLMTKQVIQTF